jgi:hypothetical protein
MTMIVAYRVVLSKREKCFIMNKHKWERVLEVSSDSYMHFLKLEKKNVYKGEAIPVTGREGPQVCEASRLPHFLVGSETVVRLSALRAGLTFTLQENSWYSFPLEVESTPGP